MILYLTLTWIWHILSTCNQAKLPIFWLLSPNKNAQKLTDCHRVFNKTPYVIWCKYVKQRLLSWYLIYWKIIPSACQPIMRLCEARNQCCYIQIPKFRVWQEAHCIVYWIVTSNICWCLHEALCTNACGIILNNQRVRVFECQELLLCCFL